MAEKILIIDHSELLRDFIKETLEAYGFEVHLAKDGLDGLIKMRNQLPDLIIMDYYLPKLNGMSFLKEKMELKTTANIPVIILTTRIDKDTIINLSKFRLYKILYKPVEIDILTQTVGQIFNKQLSIDTTPCIIDVHLNDDILFVEISKGLNKDKINLLKYKIIEIKNLFEEEIRKVLIIFTDIEAHSNIVELLHILMNNINKVTNITGLNMSVLTSIDFIIDFFKNETKFKFIKVTDNFEEAIDALGKIDIAIQSEAKIDRVKKELLSLNVTEEKEDKFIKLKFSSEKLEDDEIKIDSTDNPKKNYSIAVIDDDLPILEFMETVLSQENWHVHAYENGKAFIDDMAINKPDLIFLDLLMPVMSGFEVLNYLESTSSDIPVIILTAYPDKSSILKARQLGVKSYITKPVKADFIIHKAEEVLYHDF
jgi:DNA-binding response OmpR family regulator